jgi:hypothetical protein
MAQLHREETSMQQVNLPTDSRTAALKKTYAPPRLVEYGNLEKLTQGGGGAGNDGIGMTMACL